MSVRTKLERLERRAFTLPPAQRYSPLADEARELDREIKRLEAEIAEARVSMTPEELAQSRAEQEAFDARCTGLSLDEHIRVLEEEIALLEADEDGHQ